MQRFVLAILVCFWGFMGIRLWQVEYGGKRLGAAVDIAIVWDKILTAQDEAPLAIVNEHTGEMIGWLNWAPSVTRDDTVERGEVDGMVDTVLAYSLSVENGTYFGSGPGQNFQFAVELGFGAPPKREWENLQVKLQQYEPVDFKFFLDAQSTNNFFTASLETTARSNVVSVPFGDLKQPEKLLKPALILVDVDPFVASTALAIFKLAINKLKKNDRELAKLLNQDLLKIKLPEIRQAHRDQLPGVRSEIEVYRVDVPLGNGDFIKVYISMLGELLRVEIPDQLLEMLAKTDPEKIAKDFGLPKAIQARLAGLPKLTLPKSMVLRNENYYGRSKRQRNR